MPGWCRGCWRSVHARWCSGFPVDGVKSEAIQPFSFWWVGRVTPCAPPLETPGFGAQRSARPTLISQNENCWKPFSCS